MNVIITTPEGMQEMRDALIACKKIAAIKALRRTATPDDPEHKSISLRDAKYAVERFQNEVLGDKSSPWHPEARRIFCGPAVKEIVCDFGSGPVTVDVEAMELKALSSLNSIGLEQCGRMLELCQVIKAFSEGKRVGVIDDVAVGTVG